MNASSEQGIRLDWPKVKPPRKAFLQRAVGGLVLCAMFVAGGCLWWTWGQINSEAGMVDGRTYTITARMTDTVTQVLVQLGQSVVAGEPLLRLNGLSYQRELAEARHQVQSVRPPSIEESAERVAQAQAAEASMVQRIALARGEESNRRRNIEDSVGAHVKAQLAVRGMDAQGLQKGAAYAKAVQVEAAARVQMEQARAAAEEASRVRTAVEGELQRIRREIEAYRGQGGTSVAQGRGGNRPLASAEDDMSVISAPVAGRVALVQAVPGQRVERGQAVLQLVPLAPKAGAAEDIWILALFPEKDIAVIRPGQSCTVSLDAYADQPLRGEVEAIVPATEAVMNLLQSTESRKQNVRAQNAGKGQLVGGIPVRIRLLAVEKGTFPDMFLGMKARVRVQTRVLPSFLAWVL